MAKGRKKPPARMLYQHSPNVVEKFGPEDLHTSYYPLPGIDFHNNEQLAQWVQKYGVAPDALFRQGLAAPPLGRNSSGLRHYSAEFVGDPRMVLNLDVPLESQQPGVRDALEKLGIRSRDLPSHTVDEIWLDAIKQHGGYSRLSDSPLSQRILADLAQAASSGALGHDGLRNQIAPIVLERMRDAGIPASSQMGPGWTAGAAYAPPVIGKSPIRMLEDEASAARAEGDILRAQQLEEQIDGIDDGDVPPAGVNISAPAGVTREFNVFDPNAVNIKRIASILAAMGLGGSVASADDRYGDKTSRFSGPPAPPEPTFDERAGVQPQDTLTSRSYKRAGQYLADRGNEFGEFVSKKAGELADYASKRAGVDLDPGETADFQSNLPRQHRHFLFAVEEEMQKPVVRVAGQTISPAQYLEAVAEASGFSELTVQNAISSIKGLPFDQSDKAAAALRDKLLTQMRTNLPNRYEEGAIDTEFDTGATPEQAAEFDRDGVLEGRYRLTPEGKAGYESERAYNLFATFQNGSHRPIWSDRASKGLAAAGSVLLGMGGDKAGSEQTARLMGNRMNTPAGRMAESLYWYERGTPDGTTGDSLSGSKYPSLSSTTLEGVTTKMTNADNFLPRYNQQLSERYLYNLDVPAANRAILDRMRDDFYRTTPRYPAGADPKEVRGLIRELKDLDAEARQYASVEYPSFVRNYSISPEAFGGAPTDFTGRTVYPEKPITPVKPTYLSPFGEMIANYPRDLADAQTMGQLGLATVTGGASLLGSLANETSVARGVAKIAKSAAKGVGKAGNEAIGETPTNWAIAEVNRPAEAPGFFTPPEYHPLVTDFQGNPVRADDPNYELYKPSAYQKREDRLRRILDAGTTMYGRSPVSPSPATRSVSPVMQ